MMLENPSKTCKSLQLLNPVILILNVDQSFPECCIHLQKRLKILSVDVSCILIVWELHLFLPDSLELHTPRTLLHLFDFVLRQYLLGGSDFLKISSPPPLH